MQINYLNQSSHDSIDKIQSLYLKHQLEVSHNGVLLIDSRVYAINFEKQY